MAISRRTRTGRSRTTLVVLLLLSITIITLDFRGEGVVSNVRDSALDALSPVRDVADAAFAPVADAWDGVRGYDQLARENEDLRAQLDELRGREAAIAGAEREEQELRSLLNLTFASDVPAVAATVVGASVTNFEDTVTLDRGTDDGVAVGMPVVAGAGLVGRIARASGSRSVVSLITDPDVSVGVRFADSGLVGVAQGTGRGSDLSVDLVDAKIPVAVGAVAKTSGLQGSTYPPGIPVGTVATVASAPGALTQSVTVTPLVDLDLLSTVKVLQWPQGGG